MSGTMVGRRLISQRRLSRLRLPKVLTVALVLVVAGFSGGCSLFSPPKKESTLPYNPWIKPAKEDSKPGWLASMFPEKKKPQGTAQWIGQERPGS